MCLRFLFIYDLVLGFGVPCAFSSANDPTWPPSKVYGLEDRGEGRESWISGFKSGISGLGLGLGFRVQDLGGCRV